MRTSLIIFFLVGIAGFAVAVTKGVSPELMLNTEALLIIFGGTSVALVVGFPGRRIFAMSVHLRKCFEMSSNRDTVIREIMEIARLYRRSEIKKIEETLPALTDEHLKLGVHLLINGHEKEKIDSVLDREMDLRMLDISFSENILKTIARIIPSLGLAGTVVSLIRMFGSGVGSMDAVAPAMAVALMSTFYGVVISNLFILPLSAKMKDYSLVQEMVMNLAHEGVHAIQAMEHPLKIEERLLGRLSGEDLKAELPGTRSDISRITVKTA